MKVKIKLGGRLKKYLPDARGGLTEFTTSPDVTVAELISRLRITEDTNALLVVIDGENISPSKRAAYSLLDGQAIFVMPPLKGG